MPSPNAPPRVPDWFEPGDPWLTEKMRQVGEIAAAERELGPAVEQAVAMLLAAAQARVLRSLPAGRVTAAVDLNDWPERETVWRQAFDRFIVPVLQRLFTGRFRRQLTIRITVRYEEPLADYLDAVWARLATFLDDVFAEVREAQHSGADDEALADLLRIDAPSRARARQMQQLQATIDDPAAKESVRREARTRLAALRRDTNRSGMRWWPKIAELARTHSLSALNGGTAAGLQAEADVSDVIRFKQWWSAEDTRVRAAHIMAHGQVAPVGDTFTVGGFPMAYPGDPMAPPDLVVNCRCSLLTLTATQAARARAAYEATRAARTDRAGRAIDDNGRVVATGQPEGGVSVQTAITDPIETDVAAQPADPDVETPQPETPGEEPAVEPAAAEALTAAGREIPPEQKTIAWRGMIAPLGLRSPDGRVLAPPDEGHRLTRTLPLPLQYQEKSAPGHDGAVIVGNILDVWIDPDAQAVMGEGTFDLGDPVAREVVRKIDNSFHRWVSIAHDPDGTYTYRFFRMGDNGEEEVPRDQVAVIMPGVAFDQDDNELTVERTARNWRLSDLTLVATPAFEHAAIQLLDTEFPEPREAAEPLAATAGTGLTIDSPALEFAVATEKRNRAESSGAAMPGGRYPIENEDDLAKAIKAVGRAGGPDGTEADRKAVRRHIMKRARALGKADMIPQSWSSDGTLKTSDSTKNAVEPVDAGSLAWCERVADCVPIEPPAAWFANPQLTGPVKVMVTDEGRVYGHIAAWDTPHAGNPDVTAPHAPPQARDYGKFHRHPVRCADGTKIKTGPLATNGHSSVEEPSVWKVMAHYDNPQFVVADVVCGEDAHGIWVSGALRYGVTPVQVMMADRYSFSGDWRGRELLAACSASTPGFHLDADETVRSLVASAEPGHVVADGITRVRVEDGEVVAMIAAGVVPPPVERVSAGIVTVQLSPSPEEWGQRAYAAWQEAHEAHQNDLDQLAAEQTAADQRASRMAELRHRVFGVRRRRELERLRHRVGVDQRKVGA